jgi:DNA replication protein DnaC
MAQADCPLCGGTGWKVVEGEGVLDPAHARVPEKAAEQADRDGVNAFALRAERGAFAGRPRLAVRCDCAQGDRTARILARARIPRRYEHCDFENFETDLQHEDARAEDWNRSLEKAKVVVESFARDYPAGTDSGLLLMGPCGAGKTHLAVAALKQLVLRGHEGLFYDYRELLKEIQSSYNPEGQTTEMGVLEPVLTTELLLLDDLGASKPSVWALETVGHILNTRYNEKRVTLLTTNYLDAPATPVGPAPRGNVGFLAGYGPDTLADRVGQRIRSRLYEMCRTVEVAAPDFRREVRQAGRARA